MGGKYSIIIADSDGQCRFEEMECPKNAREYTLNVAFNDPVENESNPWLYIQTAEEKCGTFIVSLWYKKPQSNDPISVVPRCFLELYRRKPGFFNPSPQMEFVQKYTFEFNEKYTWKGESGYYKATILMNLIYDEVYNNDNLYYVKFNCKELSTELFFHMIDGYQDVIDMYSAALWVRETPIEYYNYITSSPKSKGAVDKVLYLDRTQVGIFISSYFEISENLNDESDKQTAPFSEEDILITIIAAILSEAAGANFFTGIVISLLVTGLSNYDNTIRDVDNSLKDQLKRFRDKNVKSEENSSSGSLGLESEMGLKIIFRTKLMLQTCGYHETDSIEIWDEGAAGKRIKKVAQGPKFYKGTFTIDSQILDGEPQILSFETIAAIFGWTEYLELAKQRVTTDKVEKHK